MRRKLGVTWANRICEAHLRDDYEGMPGSLLIVSKSGGSPGYAERSPSLIACRAF